MKGEFFLAWRYLKPQKSIISLLTYLSLLGPVLGVGILVVVVSVMNGMPKEMEKKLIAYNAHITVSSSEVIKNVDDLSTHIDKKYKLKTSPVTLTPVLLQREDGESEVLLAKGVIPERDAKVSQIKDMLTYKNGNTYSLKENEIIISEAISKSLELKIGDKVLLHSPEKYKTLVDQADADDMEKETSAEFTIINFFSTGMPNIDKNFLITHQVAANYLMNFPDQAAMQIEIALDDPYRAEEVSNLMVADRDLINFQITPWQREHKISGFFNMINQQKALLMFVLFFIVIGAALGVAACLFSMVIQKTQEIGILKATGVSPASIILVFISQGTILGGLGSLLGLGGGFLTLMYRDHVAKWLGAWDKELYRLENVPAYYDFSDIGLILFGSIIVCTLASAIPAIIAASVNPVKALQSQG